MGVWATRRQLSFILIFILLLIFLFVLVIAINRPVPTCGDFLANQGELGTDCGGPCTRVCSVETNDIIVLWSKVFKVKDGKYDFAAYLENPNPFGLLELEYKVKIYDTDNIPVKDVSGKTYLNAHERAFIFIPLVDLGFRIPVRAFISFPDSVEWKRLKGNIKKATLNVSNQKIEQVGEAIALKANISNDSEFPVASVELSAFLYDKDANVTNVSQSLLPSLAPSQESKIVFTWPNLTLDSIKSSEIFTRVNLVDGNTLDDTPALP
ncbi:MAG: hypothetical protein A3A27_02215 [Candidatus Wildermuthbacteria bacterium RIFCSPLOWO2_01_FULL_47_18]|uniref:CARDB domain-containing protein n=1 Tax=Candidatus Wildermuthbacteria bacterium RIFCSPLOWO2_01_FULL_47_18 TaxID=1802460 RepID=A0A1G2RKN2_9BACT|nr:MAG: hypothetical protein A3A27_02215 [Candidatus Wildermuthbacteria bacterium RIFCSPLOWO2_01_FULL_47_18]OHB18314.1 MAG: hypothetical protein A2749_00755 [Parcubacteria group bacterium RIFCSPHIGHO2_01_FULL_45_26]